MYYSSLASLRCSSCESYVRLQVTTKSPKNRLDRPTRDSHFDAADMAVAALRAQAGPARQPAEALPRFCAGFAMAQRPVHHHGPCCGSVGGSPRHADEPAQAKPYEGPPGVGAASRAEDDGKPCHCPHVAKLMEDTDVFKIRANQLEGRIDGLSGGSAQHHGAQAYGEP